MIRSCVALAVAVLPALALAQSRSLVNDDVDKFVLAHFDRIQPKSIAENREYCGLVGFTQTGELAVTPARPGNEDGCDVGEAPSGFEVLATYHTHGAFLDDADSEVPSTDDLLGDIEQGIDGYVATPGGRVWLNIGLEKLTYQLCGRNCVVSDPNARQCKTFVPAIEYTLEELRQREEQEVTGC